MFERQLEYIRSVTDFVPDTAIVLGSGCGEFANTVDVVASVDYKDIEGFPVSTAPGHNGRFIFGYAGGCRVAVMDGRVHLYEGYTPQECVMPIRLLKLMGCKNVIFTNASGGINKELEVGDFMLLKDHISCFVPSPLIGENDDSFGVRFPDMSKPYDGELNKLIMQSAKENGISVKSGVYAQLTGPQFETPAEIKMLSTLGADAVGMSTVIEVIAARHCNMKVAVISLIANLACGILDKPLTADEINETGEEKKADLIKLLTETLRKM